MDSPVVYFEGVRWRVTKPLHTVRVGGTPVQRVVITSIEGAKVSVAPVRLTPVNQVRNQA